jgi:hypothetical protein
MNTIAGRRTMAQSDDYVRAVKRSAGQGAGENCFAIVVVVVVVVAIVVAVGSGLANLAIGCGPAVSNVCVRVHSCACMHARAALADSLD